MKTNNQLKQDVIDELAYDPAVESTHIGVTVDQGVVTLTGHVSSFSEKWNAERAAQRVHGMNALVVELEVELPSLCQRNDEDIARSAKNALDCSKFGICEDINILIDKGWVTLSGSVIWQYQKLLAEDAIRNVTGIRGISNQISIKKGVVAENVRHNIEAALARHATLNAKRIKVDVHGSDVVLSGFADTWGEREAAIHASWSVPGVQSVTDRTLITL